MSTAPFQLTLFDPSRKDATGTHRATALPSQQESVRGATAGAEPAATAAPRSLPARAAEREPAVEKAATPRALPTRTREREATQEKVSSQRTLSSARDPEPAAHRSPLTFSPGRESEDGTPGADRSAPQRNTLSRPPERDQVLERANALAFRLSRELALSVRLSVTDNRSTMVSFRRAPSGLRLRLHHMFLDAPETVVQAIADYAGRGKRHAGRILDDFIRGRQPLIRQHRHDGEGELDPRGQCFDLQEIFRAINARFFQDGIQARIGWGRMPGRRRRKSIRLGVYDHQTREIRIHPSLDRVDVPRFFVEFIVFHEMLHQIFPSPPGSGRRVHHPRAFRDRERAFPLYEAAIRWEKQNLRLLLKG